MITANFSILETIRTAWDYEEGVKHVFWAVVGMLAVVTLVSGGLGGWARDTVQPVWILALVMAVQLAGSVLRLLLSMGLMYLGLQRKEGAAVQVGMIKFVFQWKLFFRMFGYILLNLSIMAPVLAGTVVFSHHPVTDFLPGFFVWIFWFIVAVWLLIRIRFTPAVLMCENAGLLTAVKKSFAITRSHVFQLLGLYIINTFMIIGGVITAGIGLVWVLPYLFINYGVVYKRLV